jgi:hypothetical protein
MKQVYNITLCYMTKIYISTLLNRDDPFSDHITHQVGLSVSLETCIREVLCSNLDRDINYSH